MNVPSDPRTRFYTNLAALGPQWQAMCRRARHAIANATGALLDADLDRAEQAVHACHGLDIMRADCEITTITVLANQAPTAFDLRQVLTAVGRLHELARMSTIAHDLAELTRTRHPAHVIPEPARPTIERMGTIATVMVTTAAESLATAERRYETALRIQYEAMAGLHTRTLQAAEYYGNDETSLAAADLATLAHSYRHFAEYTSYLGRHSTRRN
ncbi:phosphate signaling complex PhoU family protein [Nocardia brasiliensis]